MNMIEVFNYHSPVEFLNAYYLMRKSMNTKFSYELWSRELKYSSRSNLRLIVSQKRKIPDSLQKTICSEIFTTAREKKYFMLICELQKISKKSKESSQNIAKDLKNLRYKKVNVRDLAANSSVLSQVYFLVLLGFPDISEKTTAEISEKIGIEEKQLVMLLQSFEKIGLVRKKKLEWVLNEDYLIFKDDAKNLSLTDFHQLSFEKAMLSQNLNPDLRHFESLILPLNRSDYRSYIVELKEFLEEQFIKYNSKKLGEKKIYHFQTGLFPAFND